jgi:PAS domain S-box-containing protein
MTAERGVSGRASATPRHTTKTCSEPAVGELAHTVADPAFATDIDGTVLSWNQGATDFLGYDVSHMIGRRCYQVLCGTDIYGNRLCDVDCAVMRAVSLHEPVYRFAVNLRTADGTRSCARIFALPIPRPESEAAVILHILEPCRDCDGAALLENAVRAARGDDGSGRPCPLTSRELEILRLIADGKGTGNVSQQLGISVVTVRNHAQRILDKLGAHTRLAAVSVARRRGIL